MSDQVPADLPLQTGSQSNAVDLMDDIVDAMENSSPHPSDAKVLALGNDVESIENDDLLDYDYIPPSPIDDIARMYFDLDSDEEVLKPELAADKTKKKSRTVRAKSFAGAKSKQVLT